MTRVLLVLYEMFALVCTVPFRPFVMFLGCLVADPWEPGNGITPPFFLFRSLSVTFCTGLSTGYRNRDVAVASFSDRCRGTLSFHHSDNTSYPFG